jgi:hypothetical protein
MLQRCPTTNIGQHPALREVNATLREGEALFAFLDDVYAICTPQRARPIFDALGEALQRHCGIGINHGKTQVWNRGGVEPFGFRDMGTPERPVWTGAAELVVDRRGLKVLGTPLGTPEYVARHMHGLRQDHDDLLRTLRTLPELQSAWLLLSMCAGARSNYYLRALPPSLSRLFAEEHDAAMLRALDTLLDTPGGTPEDRAWAAEVPRLPLRAGGLGLRSAVRVAPAAYWASWADCLPMIQARHPNLAQLFVRALEGGSAAEPCLQELLQSRAQLVWEGFEDCPTWPQLAAGRRPQQPENAEPGEPGEWPRGWQRQAAGTREQFAREGVPQRRGNHSPASALLRSQSGPCGGKVFTV